MDGRKRIARPAESSGEETSSPDTSSPAASPSRPAPVPSHLRHLVVINNLNIVLHRKLWLLRVCISEITSRLTILCTTLHKVFLPLFLSLARGNLTTTYPSFYVVESRMTIVFLNKLFTFTSQPEESPSSTEGYTPLRRTTAGGQQRRPQELQSSPDLQISASSFYGGRARRSLFGDGAGQADQSVGGSPALSSSYLPGPSRGAVGGARPKILSSSPAPSPVRPATVGSQPTGSLGATGSEERRMPSGGGQTPTLLSGGAVGGARPRISSTPVQPASIGFQPTGSFCATGSEERRMPSGGGQTPTLLPGGGTQEPRQILAQAQRERLEREALRSRPFVLLQQVPGPPFLFRGASPGQMWSVGPATPTARPPGPVTVAISIKNLNMKP